MRLTASLVAMVLFVTLVSGCATDRNRGAGKRLLLPSPIAMDGDQPESRRTSRRGGTVKTVVEGTVASVILKSPATTTVSLKAYVTGTVRQSDDENFTLDVAPAPTDKFASGTSGSHTLFDGDEDDINLTANTSHTIYFKVDGISGRTQFTIFSLTANGSYGGAYTFVAIPAP